MVINAGYEYVNAEKKFYAAKNDEEKLLALEEMMSYMPSHKGAESLRANLRARYKKLKEDMEKKKKTKKSSNKAGIKKEGLQAVLIGLANSGKSSLLSCLTNAKPLISSLPFTTKQPILGTLDYFGVKIQLIDLPAIEFESFDQGIANTADTLLIVIETIDDIEKILPFLAKAPGEKLFIFNKIDLLNENILRKTESRLKTKKLNFVLFSAKTKENINELKDKIWFSFNKIRVYTKEPGKPLDNEPVVLEKNETIETLAKKIFHSKIKIKEVRITGPSSKFPNQAVSLSHILKDKDIVEFRVE